MITGTTRLVGLVGWPVGHSLSPAMHNAAFDHLNMNWKYVPLPVHPDSVAAAIRGMAALGFAGVNVTIPHKTSVMSHLDRVSENAKAIGAVNTVVVRQGDDGIPSLHGANTDSTGFIRSLERATVAVADEQVVVCGAGGSARAIVFGLLDAGAAHITVLSRGIEDGQRLADQFQTLAQGRVSALPLSDETIVESARTASLLINATPVGMFPHIEASIWPDHAPMPPDLTVYDLVYAPQETRLLKRAADSRAHGMGGLSMLIEQGAEAFTLWTGYAAPIAVMRQACERAIQGGCL